MFRNFLHALPPGLLGILLLSGCQPKGTHTLGKPPEGNPISILAVRAGDTPPQVVVQGRIIEKCPVAGCWFRVQDDTAVIKIDTKAAGFVVTEIPLETRVTVAGKVTHEEDEIVLNGTGLRY